MELLLYAVNEIWVVEDLFWLTVAVSFDFLFTHAYLERLAGCFSSMCGFRFAGVDVQSSFLKPGGQSFSHLYITDLFIKIVLSNQTKLPY